MIRLTNTGSEAVASLIMSNVTSVTTAFNAQAAAESVEMSLAISMSSARWCKSGKALRQDVGVSVYVLASDVSKQQNVSKLHLVQGSSYQVYEQL